MRGGSERGSAVVDFLLVSLLVTVPNVLVVNNDLPVQNVQELIALTRRD